MQRLLITDDEPIITDGLFELFSEYAETLELELYRAYSGEEAIERLNATPIDILLTDIHMPQISGLAVLRHARTLWRNCKVIMLTGYNEFKYIQEAVRNGSVDYILKTEGDAKIVQAVEKACRELKEEGQREELILQAKESMGIALPLLRKVFLQDMLEGVRPPAEVRADNLHELQIPLEPGRPLWLVLGKVDAWAAELSLADRELMLYAVNNIAEEYLQARLAVVQVKCESNQWAWLLQPREESEQTALKRWITGSLEMVQKQSERLLRVGVSFLAGGELADWNRIPETYFRMKWQLNYGVGLGREMMLHEYAEPAAEEGNTRNQFYIPELKKLEAYLEGGLEQEFRSQLTALLDRLPAWSEGNSYVTQEIFLAFASMYMTCMNRSGLTEEIGSRIDLGKFLDYSPFTDWKAVADYFLQISAIYFELRDRTEFSPYRDVIHTLETYITAHIADDLSLTRLAEVVYLNPYYLSRLYKKLTGITLTDYVMHVRIEKAKELLRSTHLKVNEISLAVGFESSAYFTRFFKRLTKMTPVEYRER